MQRYGFVILHHIIGFVTLVQLIENLVNVSHNVKISGAYIFEKNTKNLPLIKYDLDMIFAASDYSTIAANFNKCMYQ